MATTSMSEDASMDLVLVEEGGIRVVEGVPGQPFMSEAEESGRLVEACLSSGVESALLYPENLTAAKQP